MRFPVIDPELGDLVFFANTYEPAISHVGMYIANGLPIQDPDYGRSRQCRTSLHRFWGAHYAGAAHKVGR